MPGQVERWLETFMCKQYAETFEAYGFKTLQSVSRFIRNKMASLFFSWKWKEIALTRFAELIFGLSFQLCQIQLQQLQIMGVAQEHCEQILDNVDILRQSLGGMLLLIFCCWFVC